MAVTWNMHGSGISHANNDANKWDLGVRGIIDSGAPVDVIALQEAGVPPGGVAQAHYTIPQPPGTAQRPQYLVRGQDGQLVAPDVYEYPFGSATQQDGWLYWLRTDTRTEGAGQVNLAIWTRERVYDPATNPTAEGRVFVVPTLTTPDQPTQGRPALGVRLGDTVHFTVHAVSPGGANAPALANRVRTVMRTAGDGGGPLSSVLMGDFNQEAGNLRAQLGTLHAVHSLTEPTFPVVPAPGQTGRTYDYAVVPRVSDPNLQVQLRGAGRLSRVRFSDHYPVAFAFDEPGTWEPPKPPKKSRKVPVGETRLLRNAKSGNAPYPSGRGSSGGSRLSVRGVERSSVGQQRFMLQPIPESPGHFALVHRMTYTYMGLEYGAANAPAVLLPEYEADSQLWTAVDMQDGTWVLQNAATGQVLSTADTEGDEELVGRDYDASDAAQRWFFQDATTEALDVDEIVREDMDPAGWAISARDGDAENAELTMAPNGDQADQRFTRSTPTPWSTKRSQPCSRASVVSLRWTT
ncbi:RICIN domain-containing protein [Streptomyces lancefieldiae]|uniref:RICIN domain-containing protein n=1 Tax=Streptomyces lancefieldiae TaxID=3075520 RepID=A0ABU3B0Y5_9ACTN|nr:RICIN domain-containing protein [Streptomyces sp. DSM 40712]MDT0616104.1 RICIN domain-containing protein [Streptomyces sp. DSM 40712]